MAARRGSENATGLLLDMAAGETAAAFGSTASGLDRWEIA
jgi:hypothetical protein